jgi:hypothetical protein
MKKYLEDYIKEVDELLQSDKEIDYKKLKETHLERISFFQHERLIHLIVTMFFALFTIILIYFSFNNAAFSLIALALIVLLGFYIKHYYFLENSVQYLYKLYDKMNGK